MVGDKIRFRFRKSGDLRLLSHLDLTRCFERMLRRADLPFRSSLGFHPTPRMIFALSLPLGVVGECEVLELELLTPCEIEDVRERLNSQTPGGLDFHTAAAVPMKASAMPRRVQYTLDLPEDRVPEARNRIRDLLDSPKVWVERIKPKPRQLNVRSYLRDITLAPNGESEHRLTLDLWVTQSGTARADELLKALRLSDLVEAGRIVCRNFLEIHDETPSGQSDGPPDNIPPESAPLNHNPAEAGTENEPAVATWGLSPNGPVVE